MNKKKYLLIVESPHKSVTISGYFKQPLNGVFIDTVATKGHFKTLSPESGSLSYENNKYNFKWIFDEKKVSKLKENINQYDSVFILTDADREGEAIGFAIEELLHKENFHKNIYRSRFTELSKETIINCIENPNKIDINLVNAYLCRLGLDYTIGFGISPILMNFFFKKVGSLSAGRVQSPALLKIVQREKEILDFQTRKYFTIEGDFGFKTKLYEYKNEKIEEVDENFISEIKGYINKDFTVSKKDKKISIKPPLPFITSSLQKEANSKFGYTISETMSLAQQLYEGILLKNEKGEEVSVPFITYMRTDSFRINPDFLKKNISFFSTNFNNFFKSTNNYSKTKVINAQEAHECIRPINLENSPELIQDEKLKNIYILIYQRFIASQLEPSKNQITTYYLTNNSLVFSISKSIQIYEGFKCIYEKKDVENDFEIKEKTLKLKDLNLIEHETHPPDRYTEASFVNLLESNGIGRPSTYATILKTLLERNYIIKKDKSIFPTLKGTFAIGVLATFFSKYLETELTSKMEENLDKIANGDLNWEKVLREYEVELKKIIEKFQIENKGNIRYEKTRETIKNFLKHCHKCNALHVYLGNSNLVKCNCDEGFIGMSDNFILGKKKKEEIIKI